MALLLILGVASACSRDGRTLQPAKPDQTASITTAPARSVGPEPMQLFAPWQTGQEIPSEFTCAGANTSPSLSWSGVPADVKELAVVMTDVDAAGAIHWFLAGIDPQTTAVADGVVPKSAVALRNDLGGPGYSGPCPPAGKHNYTFTLYALRAPSGLAPTSDPHQALSELGAKTVATAAVTGWAAR